MSGVDILKLSILEIKNNTVLDCSTKLLVSDRNLDCEVLNLLDFSLGGVDFTLAGIPVLGETVELVLVFSGAAVNRELDGIPGVIT